MSRQSGRRQINEMNGNRNTPTGKCTTHWRQHNILLLPVCAGRVGLVGNHRIFFQTKIGTYQNSVTLLNLFLLFFNGLLNFCVYIAGDWQENQRLAQRPKSKLIFERPCYDAVFAVTVKRHFCNHPPFDRHAGRDHTIGIARYQRVP